MTSALSCPLHPNYSIVGMPVRECSTCHRMWKLKANRRVCARPGCGKVFVWYSNRRVKCCSVECSNLHRREPMTVPNAPRTAESAELLAADREKRRLQSELTSLRGRYNEAQAVIDQQQAELRIVEALKSNAAPALIYPKRQSSTSESTVVAVASDWHIEEHVDPAVVNGMNEFTLDIAKDRAARFFKVVLRLTELLQQNTRIDNMVLALLGDFITNDIHGAENAEGNQLTPNYAIVEAQNLLISGVQFLLDHSKLALTIPCHSGNHARTTITTRFANENGHSLEYLMYLHLAAYFRSEPRVNFIIAEGAHSYVQVYDQTIRFHHGHAIKYGGGVGGIYIPTNKAIAQYNKAKHADLDVFGHFHQLRDGGNFICNGSLIGWNAFAQSIKADFERPRQALFLIDKKRSRTCLWPVIVEDIDARLAKAGKRA